MRAKEEAFRILETALSIASTGVDDVEVALGGGEIGVTRIADNQVHPAAEQAMETLTIRVCAKGMLGRIETSDLSTNGIKEAAQLARSRLELLPDGNGGPGLPEPQSYDLVDAYDPDTDAMRGLDRMALVGRPLLAAHKNGLSAAGYVAIRRGTVGLDNRVGVYAVANTKGLLAYHPETRATCCFSMAHARGTFGWAQDESFSVNALDPDRLVDVAVSKATLGGEPREIAPGRYTVILEPAAVAAILRYLGTTCGAEAVDSGCSFMSGRIGEKLFSDSVTITEDHAHPLHRSVPFDFEGVAKRRVTLVKDGVVKGPVYSWRSAAQRGVEPTGHSVIDPFLGEIEAASSLVLEGGDATLDEIIGSTKSGILVTRFAGTDLIDPISLLVTGVARDGLFIVRDGEVATPIRNMRFTVSLIDVLSNVESMTVAAWASGLVVPAMKVHGFNFIAGTTL